MILIILPVVVITLCSYLASIYTLRSKIDRSENLALMQIGGNLEYMLDQVVLIAGAIIGDANILRATRDYSYINVDYATETLIRSVAENTLRASFVSHNHILNIYLRNTTGREISFGNFTEKWFFKKNIYPLLSCFENAVNGQWIYSDASGEMFKVRTGLPDPANFEKENMIHYLTPLKDYYRGNMPVGCLIVTLSGNIFEDVLSRAASTTGDNYFIVNRNLQCLYGAGENLKLSESLHEGIFDEKKDYSLIRDGGKSYVTLCCPLGDTGWFLVSASPMNIYFQDLVYVRFAVGFAAFLSLLAAIVLNVCFSRKLIEPLKDLAKNIEILRQGRFPSSAESYNADELGYIQRSFDEMAVEIKGLIDKVYQQQEAKRIAELNALQAQINPHFLYNTLNSVHCLAKINHQKQISDIMINLGSLLRISLDSTAEMLPLKDEIKYTQSFLYIANIRWENRFELYVDLSSAMENVMIPKLTLQPLVENCIRHGFSDSGEKGRIDIAVFEKENNAIIEVRDNGKGMDSAKLEEINRRLGEQGNEIMPSFRMETQSIGVYNVNARLFLRYGHPFGLSLRQNHPCGIIARLLLPLAASKQGGPNV
jgi:two-component system sensor histidine kinase YesM